MPTKFAVQQVEAFWKRRAVLIFDPLDDSEELPDHYEIVALYGRGYPRIKMRAIVASTHLPQNREGWAIPRCRSVAELRQLEAERFMDELARL